MLFGQKNDPATFKRNAVIMQGPLLSGKTKSYFDDIIGKNKKHDYEALFEDSWLALLERLALHGWKLKLGKTWWGFEEIEAVGCIYSEYGIAMSPKLVDAVACIRLPRTVTELRSFLGTCNQFRERIPGYALMVTHLTSFTRLKGKIDLTPEAVAEFSALKDALRAPAVLKPFRFGRPTYVYTDASAGTEDVPGGLGVVVVQTDDDEVQYVCAFASSALSPAQKNYHIVRL